MSHCGPACWDQNWSPSIFPTYQPPRNGGWSITTLPDVLKSDDEYSKLSWGWANRKKQANATYRNAITEMVNFLTLNGILITPELKREIRRHGDAEWCSRDPSRCPRKPSKDAPKTLQMTRRAAVASSPTGCGGCGGGRVR